MIPSRLVTLALLSTAGCTMPVIIGSGGDAGDGGAMTTPAEGGTLDACASLMQGCTTGMDGGSTMDAGPSTCMGSAPLCFGNDDTQCCGQDPSGSAVCVGGQWLCGMAAAPGCDPGCMDGGSMGGMDAGASTCMGPAPNCFGTDLSYCCGMDPIGPATCVGTEWLCGMAPAPGCTACMGIDAGPGGGMDAGTGMP